MADPNVQPIVPTSPAVAPAAPVLATPPTPPVKAPAPVAPAPVAPAPVAPAPVANPAIEATGNVGSTGTSVTGEQIKDTDPRVEAELARSAAAGTVLKREQALQNVMNQQGPTAGAKVSIAGATGPAEKKETAKTDTGINDKIAAALTQGYASPQDIANFTGIPLADVTNSINTSTDYSYMMKENETNNKLQSAATDYQNKMDQITNGTFKLTPTEQAQIDATKTIFDQMKQDQILANKNYEGGVQTAEVRTGRQEFLNQISQGIYKQAVDAGLAKIRKIDADALAATQTLQNAFKDQNYKVVQQSYDTLDKSLRDKSKAISDIHKATVDMQERIDKQNKEDATALVAKQNQAKLLQTTGVSAITAAAPALSKALTGDIAGDEAILQNWADFYGLPLVVVQGLVQKQKSAEEATAQKQTNIETAAQAKETATQQAAAAKASATKIITIGSGKNAQKVVVDSKGNIVKKVGGGTVSPSGTTRKATSTAPKLSKEEATFSKDLMAARKALASGKEWGQAWNYLKNQYGVPNETLDALLNKEQYYTQ